MATQITLPKDAEGREIPLDTEVLYDMCGTKVSVNEFLFSTLVENQRTQWTIKAAYEGNFYYNSFKPENMHLTQPDSWEKLEEDLNKCISNNDSCCYFSKSGACCDCTIDSSSIDYKCESLVFNSIKERIRKLRNKV